MKNRLLSIFLALAMVFALAGCAASSNNEETSTANAEYTTKLFGEDVITINITTSEEDWDYLIENATSKPYISADVEIDGVTYEDVGIKTKGNTSLTQVANSGSDRYSLKINFDKYVDGQDCYGLDSLVLNNLYSDNSYLKEYMSYALMDYMESWVDDAISAAGNSDLAVVEASKGATPITNSDQAEIAEHGQYDPHLWLSLKGAETEAENIRDGLIQADPDHTDYYTDNCSDFVAQLEELYNSYSQKFEAVTKKNIVTGHGFAALPSGKGIAAERNSAFTADNVQLADTGDGRLAGARL